MKDHRAPALGLLEHVSTGHVPWQEIRRELQPLEVEAHEVRQGLDEFRLAEPGQAFQEHVATGKQRHDHHAGELGLAEDHGI